MKTRSTISPVCGPLFVGCLFAITMPLIGCGSSEGSSSTSAAVKEPKSKPDKSEAKRSKSEGSKTDGAAGGPKMVGDIPYDVFFDKPLVVAANTQTGSAANAASVAANEASKASPADSPTPSKQPAKDASAGGAAATKDLIDKESLAGEIKNVRNYLANKASSVGTYNSSYLEIPPEAATLAVLAVAVSKHPEDFSWKKNAKYVRELAFKIAELTASKEAKNKNTFDQVADAFSKIDDILKGSEPAGLPDAEAEKSFGDAVGGNLVMLMKRLKKSEEILKATVSNEAGLKKEAEKVALEGAILAFMGGIITQPGFGWDGDAEFATYAKPLVDGGKQLMEAAKTGNYALYGEGIGKVSKSCNDCHPKFTP